MTYPEITVIIYRISGYGEVWYRAWFGSKRPRVRIPILRPYKVDSFDTRVSETINLILFVLILDLQGFSALWQIELGSLSEEKFQSV